jgi:predicted amidohydrolase
VEVANVIACVLQAHAGVLALDAVGEAAVGAEAALELVQGGVRVKIDNAT